VTDVKEERILNGSVCSVMLIVMVNELLHQLPHSFVFDEEGRLAHLAIFPDKEMVHVVYQVMNPDTDLHDHPYATSGSTIESALQSMIDFLAANDIT